MQENYVFRDELPGTKFGRVAVILDHLLYLVDDYTPVFRGDTLTRLGIDPSECISPPRRRATTVPETRDRWYKPRPLFPHEDPYANIPRPGSSSFGVLSYSGSLAGPTLHSTGASGLTVEVPPAPRLDDTDENNNEAKNDGKRKGSPEQQRRSQLKRQRGAGGFVMGWDVYGRDTDTTSSMSSSDYD